MSERLYNALTSHCAPALELRLETLSAIVEEAMVLVCKIPESLNDHISDIKQKISHLSDRLDVMDEDITEIKSFEENEPENDISNSHLVSPVALRSRIMEELRGLFSRPPRVDDEKYEARKCFACKGTLTFREFCTRNPNEELKWLEDLWTHPMVQIYCCSCYDRFVREERERARFEESLAAREHLKAEEREALVFIENRLGINIMLTDQIRTYTYRYRNTDSFARQFTMKGRHITGLKLSLCGLTSLPPEIQLFTKLNILDLSDNLMLTIPDWIGNLSRLCVLDLSHNNLSEIPESVLNNEKLQIFPLSARKRNPMVEIIRELKTKFGNEIPIRH